MVVVNRVKKYIQRKKVLERVTMSTNKYPEQVPKSQAKMEQFLFNVGASGTMKSELESQLSTLQDRIQNIVNTVTLNDMPILGFVLQNSHDKKELKKFAKAVDRVADLVDAADNIESRINIINTAEKDPNWFAVTFGDYTKEIDEDIENIFK